MGALADAAAVTLHSLSPPPDAEAAARLNELVQRTGALAKALEEQLDALRRARRGGYRRRRRGAARRGGGDDAAARLRSADECRAALRAAREEAAAKGDHAAHASSRTSSSSRRGVLGGVEITEVYRGPKCRCAFHCPSVPPAAQFRTASAARGREHAPTSRPTARRRRRFSRSSSDPTKSRYSGPIAKLRRRPTSLTPSPAPSTRFKRVAALASAKNRWRTSVRHRGIGATAPRRRPASRNTSSIARRRRRVAAAARPRAIVRLRGRGGAGGASYGSAR